MQKTLTLIVEDDTAMQFALHECLKEKHDTIAASDGQQAVEIFLDRSPGLVLLDLKIPKLDGLQVLRKIKQLDPEAVVIILTGHATISHAVESMKEGAYDFIPKPFEVDQLRAIIDGADAKVRVINENRSARENIQGSANRIYTSTVSPENKKMEDFIDSIAGSDYTILIEGESGTGKSLLAEEIHRRSKRCKGPFALVDCAALPSSLVESELFGYEKGAFTGAVGKKIGKLERAHGGTLFLDEIGTLDLNGQASLLSVIQNKEFERVGGTGLQAIDMRIIAASNHDLKQMVKEKTFRHDLYYRLNVFNLFVPPLRQRVDDIIPLAYYFIHKYGNRKGIGLSTEAALKLKSYDWPGNIRELENAIKHALILMKQEINIQSAHLPLELNQGYWAFRDKKLGLKETLAVTEKTIIQQTLLENDFNMDKCAKILKMPKRTLYYRMKKAGINQLPS